MYTLRTITSSGLQSNRLIGKAYAIIYRDESYDEFKDVFKKTFNKPHVADLDETSDDDTKQCYAIIIEDGSIFRPLYKKQKNYIMTSEGKTFDNVSYR